MGKNKIGKIKNNLKELDKTIDALVALRERSGNSKDKNILGIIENLGGALGDKLIGLSKIKNKNNDIEKDDIEELIKIIHKSLEKLLVLKIEIGA